MLWASYSYSEPYEYGTTGNVAGTYTWNMSDYMPDYPVIDINAVIYQYTTQKNTADDMLVYIQNKDTAGSGYIFRETDDWSGLPSGTINKFVPVDNISASRFGEGSIEVEGVGKVTQQTVKYNYRIDMAEVPEPDVITYAIPEVTIDVYNVLEDDSVSSVQADSKPLEEQSSDDKDKKEKAEKAAEKAIGIGNTAAQQAMMAALTQVTLASYTAVTIKGGTYKEYVTLNDSKLPENKRGLRNNLAQQILHIKMVDSQYEER